MHICTSNANHLNPDMCHTQSIPSPAYLVSTFLNRTIVTWLPGHNRWVKETTNDDKLAQILAVVQNPLMLTKDNLLDVNYNYHHTLHHSLISLEDNILIYDEPLLGGDSYTHLCLVPQTLHNIVFVAFHSNPIGGHFNAARTFHRLCLHFYWPHMYKYIEDMCRTCPGCALSNPTKINQQNLYTTSQLRLHSWYFMLISMLQENMPALKVAQFSLYCSMCTFACKEPIVQANASSFASAFMKIQLQFGICHTVILDKDSKFLGVFWECLDLLKIHYLVLLGENQNPMMVEWVNRYLNKGLKIMTSKQGNVCVTMESILLLLYAWNSSLIPGTDISRSMVAIGRKFAFPIDYLTKLNWNLTQSTPESVTTYSSKLAMCLAACWEIVHLLVSEHCALHHELINECQLSPRLYHVGDYIFAITSLHAAPLAQALHMSTSINSLMHTLGHGRLPAFSPAAHIRSSTAITTNRLRRSMPPTCPHTHSISSHSRTLTVQIADIAASAATSYQTHFQMLASQASPHPNHFNPMLHTHVQALLQTSHGHVLQILMQTILHQTQTTSHHLRKTIHLLPNQPPTILDHCHCHLLCNTHKLLHPLMPLLHPSLPVMTSCSSLVTKSVLAVMYLNGKLYPLCLQDC